MSDTTPPPASEPQPAAPLTHDQDVLWGSLAQLGGIIGPLPSLIIWLVFKDRGPFTNVEAKEGLNFQITAVLAYVAIVIVNSVLSLVTFGFWNIVGWLLPTALWVTVIVFSILAYVTAKDGTHYRYPFAIRFIK